MLKAPCRRLQVENRRWSGVTRCGSSCGATSSPQVRLRRERSQREIERERPIELLRLATGRSKTSVSPAEVKLYEVVLAVCSQRYLEQPVCYKRIAEQERSDWTIGPGAYRFSPTTWSSQYEIGLIRTRGADEPYSTLVTKQQPPLEFSFHHA